VARHSSAFESLTPNRIDPGTWAHLDIPPILFGWRQRCNVDLGDLRATAWWIASSVPLPGARHRSIHLANCTRQPCECAPAAQAACDLPGAPGSLTVTRPCLRPLDIEAQ